ncbi:RlpA-like double-psi beta-barrel-protein domain-containing protein-containing protein [Aspergillus floccosus]
MKYQHLASFGIAALGAASVSASPLLPREDHAQCPPGYTMSVYYKTITLEPTPSVEPITTIQATSTVTETVTASPEASSVSVPVEAPTTAVEVAPTESPVDAIESSVSVGLPPSLSSTSTSTTVHQKIIVPAEPTTIVAPQPTTAAAVISTSQPQQPSTTAAAPSASTSPSSSSASTSKSETYSGKATFYGGNVSGGTCSFTGYTLPSGLFGTAYSGAQWNDASQCGACVQVTGPNGNSIKAMIVDQCPECEATHLDLFQNGFSELAALADGVISIDWSFVSCDIDTPLVLKNKEGTSQYWFSMQVVNANEPVTSLEVSTDGGSTWHATTRTFYNYFENDSGFGTDSVDVRITGQSGKTVRVNNVGCSSGSSTTASANF